MWAWQRRSVWTCRGCKFRPAPLRFGTFHRKSRCLAARGMAFLATIVISRLVVSVDYEKQQIAFRDPLTFVPGERATALPITFLRNIPVLHAKIALPGRAPVDAECAVDSGADGETKEYAGRIASLQLGPYVLREPIATFSPEEQGGLLASSDIGAILGGRILKRFTVTFDYPHHRMLLEPNGQFSEPFRVNESGLSLLAKGPDFHRFEVDGVEPNSPADVAGMKVGDLLTAIDGRPAGELDLQKIDEILQQGGQTISLTVLRNGRRLKISLTLRERI